MTPIPAACSTAMTPAHIDASANAPCTRSTVGVLPFRGVRWLIARALAAGKALHKARAAGRVVAWVT